MNNQTQSTYLSLVRSSERSRETPWRLNSFDRMAKRLGILAFGLVLLISTKPARADDALTARNKEIVRNFYTTVLIGRDVDAAPRFMRSDYIQHNPQVPTGLKGFMDTFRERFAQKLPPDYKRELLNVIGDNDMVVVYVRQTWTGKDGQHHQALGFDMFRVQDGMVAEHWDAD
jgi:predicted SnoaL-like aldol condensation-catalyzing enzyme